MTIMQGKHYTAMKILNGQELIEFFLSAEQFLSPRVWVNTSCWQITLPTHNFLPNSPAPPKETTVSLAKPFQLTCLKFKGAKSQYFGDVKLSLNWGKLKIVVDQDRKKKQRDNSNPLRYRNGSRWKRLTQIANGKF